MQSASDADGALRHCRQCVGVDFRLVWERVLCGGAGAKSAGAGFRDLSGIAGRIVVRQAGFSDVRAPELGSFG